MARVTKIEVFQIEVTRNEAGVIAQALNEMGEREKEEGEVTPIALDLALEIEAEMGGQG